MAGLRNDVPTADSDERPKAELGSAMQVAPIDAMLRRALISDLTKRTKKKKTFGERVMIFGDRKLSKFGAFSGTLTRIFHAKPRRWLHHPFIQIPILSKSSSQRGERNKTVQARRLIGRPWTWASPKPPLPTPGCLGRQRLMVTKPPTRAAVHGVKLPVPDILDKEEAEKEIEKGKREKEEKRKQLEEAVDAKINSSEVPLTPVK
ncbi:hypothetical protein NL676_006541 [Syzygium grande]|nr:hypothetical protein NL676_006541 [Syzygium grande]